MIFNMLLILEFLQNVNKLEDGKIEIKFITEEIWPHPNIKAMLARKRMIDCN